MSMSSTKATYLLQQENKTNKGRLSLAVPHSDSTFLSQEFHVHFQLLAHLTIECRKRLLPLELKQLC